MTFLCLWCHHDHIIAICMWLPCRDYHKNNLIKILIYVYVFIIEMWIYDVVCGCTLSMILIEVLYVMFSYDELMLLHGKQVVIMMWINWWSSQNVVYKCVFCEVVTHRTQELWDRWELDMIRGIITWCTVNLSNQKWWYDDIDQ